MKIEPRRVEAFLRDPGPVRIVLLHGEDHGLIAERASSLVRHVAGTLDDPFRVVILGRDEAHALPAEMCGLSLTGGRRVLHVREATDAFAEPVRESLAGPGGSLAVLEAGVLQPRSKLRLVIEASDEGAAIACYPDDAGTIRRVLKDELLRRGVDADEDALAWLGSRIPDRGSLRQEAEKLALLVGPGGHVDFSTAVVCTADFASQSIDDALYAAGAGDVQEADRGLARAISEGIAPVQLVRAGLAHIQRLLRAKLAMASGMSAGDAVRGLRPPIHFKRLPQFSRALALWSLADLASASRRLQESERSCKTTGLPADEVSQAVVLSMAQRAAGLARR